jgi:hypothetical protein
MSFKNKKYLVIKQAVPKDIVDFVYKYFLLKRDVYRTLREVNYISFFNQDWGTFNDPQVPNTYSHYGDLAMETLLFLCIPIMEKKTKLKLLPTYSYARIYKKGDILERHKDRFSCEISTTLNLGGDPWPIYLESKKNVGLHLEGPYVPSNNKGTKIILKPGDMLIYQGRILEHWREPFDGNDCGQVFLHYNIDDEMGRKNIFDNRPHLGLPSLIKNKQV